MKRTSSRIALDNIYEKISIIEQSCTECINMIPDTLWNNMDDTVQNTINNILLDKALKINHIYEELSEILFIDIIPSIMMSKKVLSNKNNDKTYTNYNMTYYLLNGHITLYDNNNVFVGNEVLIDLFEHIYIKTTYIKIINKADTSSDAYNYISRCITNKLIDMVNEKKKTIKNEDTLEQQIELKNGEKIDREFVSNLDIEKKICDPYLYETVKGELIHKTIKVLYKHPDRLIAYLNNVVDGNTLNLLTTIKNIGYDGTLEKIIKIATNLGINLSYLKDAHFQFKIAPEELKRENIDNWTNRYRKDIRSIVDEFKEIYV